MYLQGANEIETRVKVGNNRREVLDELYNITGITVKITQAFNTLLSSFVYTRLSNSEHTEQA